MLYSNYIIDGVQQALSPARMLRECTLNPPLEPDGDMQTIADEHLDAYAGNPAYDVRKVARYAQAIEALGRRPLPLPFAGPYTAARVAQSLIDVIWMNGHFRLGDLTIKADWKWNARELGYAAAFYSSVESACDYIDALGVKIDRYSLSSGTPSVNFKAGTVAEEDAEDEEESFFRELPYRTANPRISRRRKVSVSLCPEASDWIVYIPFDTCDYRLGGSALAHAMHTGHATAPDVSDADYFIDCYEVVRELVEDGIVKAGATVGNGGLEMALRSMVGGGVGADVCLADVARAYGGEHPVRILFAEVPGVVLQIADADYDYIDAELILQDVVYFPLGHPVPGRPDIRVTEKVEIPQILESLLNTLEGED